MAQSGEVSSFFSHEAPGVDRLGNLPKNVLDRILVRLPMMDLVRTSILNRSWRYAWSSVPDLTFDQGFQLALKDQPSSRRLLRIVDHILLFRSAPVHRFQISCGTISRIPNVSRWISYLARNGIAELCLQLDPTAQKISLAPCLLACKQLTVLVLCCSKLTVSPCFQDFMNLREIDLKVASVSEIAIDNLVSYSPFLEKLNLEIQKKLRFLKINAAKLKNLSVTGTFPNLYLDGCSQLTHCKFFLEEAVEGNKIEYADYFNLEKLLGCSPMLEELIIEGYFVLFLSWRTVPHTLASAFEHLKVLELQLDSTDTKQMAAAFCIFRSSPKLASIEIFVGCEAITPYDDSYSYDNESCVFNSLKIFSIYIMNGMAEMELLKYVLGNAPILEMMKVNFDVYGIDPPSDFLKELLLFRRASSSAEVIV